MLNTALTVQLKGQVWMLSMLSVLLVPSSVAKDPPKCKPNRVNQKDCQVVLQGASLTPSIDSVILQGGVAIKWMSDSRRSFSTDLKDCKALFQSGAPNSYSSGDPAIKTQDTVACCSYTIGPKASGAKIDPHIIVVSGSRGDHTDAARPR